MAKKNKIHISLVIHPRKSDENKDLDTSCFYGSGKAS